jgi:hypothetical protein
MELLSVSKLAVNFSSTAIEEIVHTSVPVINFDIKPHKTLMPYLYEYNYCQNLPPSIKQDELINIIKQMVSNNYNEEFNRSRERHLGKGIGVSKDILDLVVTK